MNETIVMIEKQNSSRQSIDIQGDYLCEYNNNVQRGRKR